VREEREEEGRGHRIRGGADYSIGIQPTPNKPGGLRKGRLRMVSGRGEKGRGGPNPVS